MHAVIDPAEILLGKRIGSGAFGSAYSAVYLSTGERLAVKSVPVRRVDEGLPRSVMQEAEALRCVEHVNLVPLLALFTRAHTLCLATPMYVGDVAALVRARARHGAGALRLPMSCVKSIVQQISFGLAALHAQSLLHRDVKTANFLLASDGTVALCDMGLATIYDERIKREGLSANAGSKCYRAPELALGSNWYSYGVDIWALSCALCELIEGEPVFPCTGDIGLLGQIAELLGKPSEASFSDATNRALPNSGRALLQASSEANETSTPDVLQQLQQLVPTATPDCLNLLQECFKYNENRRCTAAKFAQHHFFTSPPIPSCAAYHLVGPPD